MTQTRVVLIGGGYVSIWAARALRRWARRRVDVTIVAPEPAHSFHGWTGEVIAGDLPAQASWTPLSEAAREARVITGRVDKVDRSTQTVHVRAADGRTSVVGYDHLVVGCGTTDRTDTVPGLAERAYSVRGFADVRRLLDAVDRVCPPQPVNGRLVAPQPGRGEPTGRSARDSQRPHELLTAGGGSGPRAGRGGGAPLSHGPSVVVVGGGFAGVELAGALARRVGGGIVTLVQRSDHIGADLTADHAGLGRRMSADLAAVGVTVRTGSALVGVGPDSVVLASGDVLPADVVVAASGTRVRALPGLDDLPADPAGRLLTDDQLLVADGVWAGGDAASVPFVLGGSCPASALWAITHGTRIGRSIARVTRGRRPGRYRFRGIGRAASLGPGRGYVELRGVPMTGWLAWVVRLLFFLRYAPSGRQALRVARMWLSLPWRRVSTGVVAAAQPSRTTGERPVRRGPRPVVAAARSTIVGTRRPA